MNVDLTRIYQRFESLEQFCFNQKEGSELETFFQVKLKNFKSLHHESALSSCTCIIHRFVTMQFTCSRLLLNFRPLPPVQKRMRIKVASCGKLSVLGVSQPDAINCV